MSEQISHFPSHEFRRSLEEKHYAPIGLDIGYADFEEAARAFEEFMQLPAMYSDRSRHRLDERNNSTFGAFERRVGEQNQEGRGLNQDNKNIFHFGSLTRQVMEHRLGSSMPKEATEFLKAAEEIYWSGLRSMKDGLSMLDHEHTGLVGIHFDEREHLNHHVRFAAYYPREGELLATPHKDRSTATIALAENKPGLWVETPEGKQYIPSRKDKEGIFFLGAGWDELPGRYRIGNEAVEPAYHGVDQLDDEADEHGAIRWAIILFANPYELDTVPSQIATRPYKAIGQEVFAAAGLRTA